MYSTDIVGTVDNYTITESATVHRTEHRVALRPTRPTPLQPSCDPLGKASTHTSAHMAACPVWLPVLAFSVLTVASASLQAVVFKLTGYVLGPFPYFILLCVSFAFVPIFFSGVFCIERYAKIAPAARAWSYKKAFMLIGLLNGLNGVMIIFSNPHVAGVAQSTLSQAVIPLTLGLSVLILRSSFSKMMWLGAFVILCGVGVELSPSFILPLQSTPAQPRSTPFAAATATAAAGDEPTNQWWSVVFALGQLPAALCSIYQEQAFTRGVRINVVYMMAWSSLAQFVSLCIAAPLDFIPGFGNSGTFDGFLLSFRNASLCVANDWPDHPECGTAGVLLACCIVTMLLTNIFQALLVKHSSASLSVLVLTLITPASTFCFTFPALMGENHTEKMSSKQWVALVVLMAGVGVYRYADVNQMKKEVENGGDNQVGGEAGRGTRAGGSKTSNSEYGSTRDARSFSAGSSMSSSTARSPRRFTSRPMMMSSRSGIINCEYTGGVSGTTSMRAVTSILFEGTQLETSLHQKHQSAPLLTRSMPQAEPFIGGGRQSLFVSPPGRVKDGQPYSKSLSNNPSTFI